jgi:hypothetical protein
MDNFRRENVIVLPGVEIDLLGQQFLQIYVPDYYRRRIPFFKGKEWFLILAHPGYYSPLDPQILERISFDAVEAGSLQGEFSSAYSISRDMNLPSITSSDAHKLDDIGFKFTEMEIGARLK